MSPESRRRMLRLLAPVLGVVLVLVQWWPMVAAFPHTPPNPFDGRYALHQFEIAKASLRYYGEVALWNPFDCRGIPMWDFPESMTSSPIFFATAMFDNSLVGLYAWNILHALAGFFAMWILARRGFLLGRLASFVSAAMWALGSWHIVQAAGNHETFVSFYPAPLFLYLWRRAEERLDCAVLAGLLLAWMIYDGGTYAVPFSVAMLGVETLTRLRSLARVKRIVLAAAVAGLVSVAVSASRLLPLADQFGQHSRSFPPDNDHMMRAHTLWATFFYRGPADPLGTAWPGQQYGFDEYVIYFGWLGMAVCAIGAVVAWKEHRWTVFVAVVMMVFALGHFAPWSPWTVLQRHVFPFTSMRVSSRFVLLLALFMCVWMGLAVERAPAWVARWTSRESAPRVAQWLVTAVALAAMLDSMKWGRDILAMRFTGPPVASFARSERFFYGGDDVDPDFLQHPRQNHAYLGCRAGSFSFHQAAPTWTGDVAQAQVDGDGATLANVARTHNTFRLDVDATKRVRIRLNSAYDRGWQTNDGEVVEDNHLLTLWVEPGHHSVRMRYWPRTLTFGIVLSCLGLLGAVAFLARGRLARRVLRRIA